MIIDLQDGRRSAKPWLPDDDRDVSNGLVVEGPDGKPSCKRHGAMNRVDPHRRIYRCQEMCCGVGAEVADAPSSDTIWMYDDPGSSYHDTQRCRCDDHCRNCFADLAEIRDLHARLIAEQSPAAPDRALHPQARYCSEWCRGRAKRERALDRRLTAAR